MKKIAILFLFVFITLLCADGFGQAQKRVLFEHFTQASCGPCAQQNPGFQNTILANNLGRLHHIAYHTSWPGVDPMYTYYPQGPNDRVTYYSVTGVPTMRMLGNKFIGSPAGVTQAMVDEAAGESSPIRIRVKQNSNGTDRFVTVTVYTLATVSAGNYKMRGAVIETMINYTTAPGTNGEKDFPNVLRKMIPNTAGDTYTPAAIGDSVVFNYQYTLDLGTWDTTRIEVVAFIEDDATKEVIQSGATWDSNFEMTTTDLNFDEGVASSNTNFNNILYYNLGSGSENYRFTLVPENAPSGWTASFEINSNTYGDSVDLVLSGYDNGNVKLTVTPSTTSGIGKYTMTMQSLDNPQFAAQRLTFYVISGVTDLVVNNNGAQYEQDYFDALDLANNTTYGFVDIPLFIKGQINNKMAGVYNVYFNVEWTFPGLTDENVVALQNHLDAGGNLFIAGQDIGWDSESGAQQANGTANTQAFYANYLNTVYIDDGSTANNMLDAVTADGIFGNVNSSSIVDIHSGNMYPEELQATGLGTEIFNYNGGPKAGGIRAYDTSVPYKVVYMGIDMRMVNDQAVRLDIIKLSHDWFYALVSTEEYENAMKATMGQNYPNPSSDYTTIPLNNVENDVRLEVVDVTGRVVRTQFVSAFSEQINVNTMGLESGMYLYQLVDGNQVLESKPMQVVK